MIARSLMRDLDSKVHLSARSMEEEATSNQCSRNKKKQEHGHRNWLRGLQGEHEKE